MQITRIECRLGATVNAGDFQSIKSEVMAQADIDRNEDPIAAYTELAEFVRAALVNGANVAHPDKVRLMLTSDARLAEAAEGNKKPGRKPKAAEPAPAPAQEPAKLADTTGMDIGGLNKEPGVAAAADDLSDLDDLLGTGTTVEAVTKEDVQAAMVKLNKKAGKAGVLHVLKQVGATNLSNIPEAKWPEALKLSNELAAATGTV